METNAVHDVRGPRTSEARRWLISEAAAFWVLAALFLMLFFASAAASPLYPVYKAKLGFSAITLTAVFAAYVLALLLTLLCFGAASDYVGRLPMIVAALVVSAGACIVFAMAHGVGALYVARALQGVATGLATGAIGAGLIDLQRSGRERASLVTSVFSSLGLAFGALLTSLLVEYAPAPTHLIWWALLAAFAVGLAAVPLMAEPAVKRPGLVTSLRPRVSVPAPARTTFARAIPFLVAGWGLAGFYLSLGPSVAAEVMGSSNPVWGGLVIFLLFGAGAGAVLGLRNIDPRTAVLIGCVLLLAGAAVTFGAIAGATFAGLLAGTIVAGVGFSLAFVGSLRIIAAPATPDQRAALISAVYIVSYVAFSVPALIAGVAVTEFGLHATALGYSASVAVLAAVSVAIRFREPTSA